MSRKTRILIVEDEPTVRALMRALLQNEGFIVTAAEDVATAEAEIRFVDFSLVLLDLSLPDEDGLVLARRLRARSSIPIIFVTHRDADSEKITALEMGGDDYITKPFHPRELVARVRSVLRRSSADFAQKTGVERVRVGEWVLDLSRRTVIARGGGSAKLTRAEFDVLAALVQADGRVMSRAQLLDAMAEHRTDGTDRTIDVLVSRIRKKLSEPGKSRELIDTVPTIGYKIGADVVPF
ncbi:MULTISPECIES: response regulator transcription factor [unclassified Ruegeria]|nr:MULTISPECIES: response regulator transcription factor [Ruegeria]